MFTTQTQTYGKSQNTLNLHRLPARLNVEQAAALLGCQPHDVPILVRAKLLTPLGKPLPNLTKYFATCVLEELRLDVKWLDAATKAIYSHWRDENFSRRSRANSGAPTPPETGVPSDG